MSSSKNPPFRVREYRPSDFPQLCAIDRLCFSEAIAYTPEEIALGLAQPGAFALVAEAQDAEEQVAEAQKQVIAFVLAQEKRRGLGHIITIDVRDEFRRLGLGAKLMELAEARLRQRGVSRVVLEVSTQNEHAMRFYQELGYVTRRHLPGYYPDGSDAYLMEKAFS
jgi:ribosomal protein S18 acetylase RimI-like enzyme